MKKTAILFAILGILLINTFSFANNNWSEWQDEAISSSDTIEVETRKVPSSYIMVSFVCGVSGYPRGYYSWNKGSFRTDYTFEWTASEFDNAIVYHEGDYFDFYDGTAADGLIGGGGNAYVKDSDWYIPCYVRETKYKTQYRYKEIQKEVVNSDNSSADNENHKSQTTQPTTKAITREKTYETSKSNIKERSDIVKENKKSKGKSTNGGAKIWSLTSENQDLTDDYIIMEEVINDENVKTIIPNNSAEHSSKAYEKNAIDDIFNQSSYIYNKRVAHFAAILSKEVYDDGRFPGIDFLNELNDVGGQTPYELKNLLYKTYGFLQVETYNYTSNDKIDYNNSNCFVIGHRKYGNTAILCIIARGTRSYGELMADGLNNTVKNGIYTDIVNFSDQISKGVGQYFNKYSELKNVSNLKVLIAGHSLGGAAANLYGAMFLNDVKDGKCVNKYIKTEDVFTYTYGAIKVIDCNTYDNIIDGFENIFNIYNYYDSFGPNGTKNYFGASSPCQKFGYTLIYQDARYYHRENPNNPLDIPNHNIDNYIKVAEIYDFKDYKIAEDLTKTGEIIIEEVIDGKDITTIIPDMSHNVMNENVELDNFQSYYDKPLDVTSNYNGRLVKIFSKETNHYISDEEETIHADGEGGEGVFITQTTSDGWVGFKRVNGNWLSVQDQGYVRAEGANLSSWECFKVYQYKDNMYLLSQKENKYVQVINDGIQITNPLQAARKIEDGLEGATWERFDIVFVDGK